MSTEDPNVDETYLKTALGDVSDAVMYMSLSTAKTHMPLLVPEDLKNLPDNTVVCLQNGKLTLMNT